jgi:hypothetical protein
MRPQPIQAGTPILPQSALFKAFLDLETREVCRSVYVNRVSALRHPNERFPIECWQKKMEFAIAIPQTHPDLVRIRRFLRRAAHNAARPARSFAQRRNQISASSESSGNRNQPWKEFSSTRMRRDSAPRLLCRDVHSDELQRSQVASPMIYTSLQFVAGK